MQRQAGVSQHLSRLGTTAGWLWIPPPGCSALLSVAKPSVVSSTAVSRSHFPLIVLSYHNHIPRCVSMLHTWLTSPLHLSTKHQSGSGSRQSENVIHWPLAMVSCGPTWGLLELAIDSAGETSVGKGGGPGGAFPLCAGVRDVLFPLMCLMSLMCCPLFCPFTQRCEPSTSLCLSPTMLLLSLPMTLPTPTCLRL